MNTDVPSSSAPASPADTGAAPGWIPLDAAADEPTPLYDIAAIRRIEQAGLDATPPFTLMSRAGAAAADWIHQHVPNGRILFLAGRGNNGGDALVAATRLHQSGRLVEAWLIAEADQLPADAARAWFDARTAGVPLLAMHPDPDAALPPWPTGCVAVVDGLLGIGLNRAAGGDVARWIAHLNASHLPVYALDIPSGLFADTGAGQPAVRARRTLTFLAAKPGLLTLDGRDCAGAIDIAPLGLDYPPAERPVAIVNQPGAFSHALPRREHASNKGRFGSLAVIGGNHGMTGAPLLGARAALHLGAGRVHVGFLAQPAPAIDPIHPELMLHPAAELSLDAMSAFVAGPGMGSGTAARKQLAQLIDFCANARPPLPLVLDADALNLLAADETLRQSLIDSGLDYVMTPHPLEAARLLGSTVADVQRDRLAAAHALARRWQATVVLKGSGTVIASHEDAPATVNPTGNAGLSTAGTGDVLAGMIGALLAQGMPTLAAARAAVWIHGRAADRLVEAGTGPAGLTASELYLPARAIFNVLLQGGAA
ncbi:MULTISPECIES: NAD(P)H-hydrate dehydratase [unclassified Cupriavidus]|uniref:NAD(P)H-hydrate dehydratase n=1 Tax=unclassified Cupriavidus TaxID=2640874 RepID=UPI001C000807|nr:MULTISPECIES: NAD(P)H-hydrate dehydratase [unclassified Cupriavidus]MCA3185473.1 NAD(P)H-hydrate dehydratase [Cupriavidus sp.]MCA3189357.1 NAD(P)H-hydrate dehydratase [Cupriavidus sp.]MCA3195437.1 NAD(P)H-hydrate dehydratase [Cupriavidus sp.]MCA3200992.1 NAD(P)H-hydrate dehydratase [Cupriavidus sp.]MCA3208364.1 NAD(P)H-hydrate dehydratase [Cupriavidus sp.]